VDHRALPRLSLSDGSVRLRPLAEEDVPALIAAVLDPLISLYTFWPNSMSPEEAVERIRRAEASRVAGTRLELAVVEPATDELLGFVGLEPDWQDRRAAGASPARSPISSVSPAAGCSTTWRSRSPGAAASTRACC
jgi:RimJ/RimL family protein N-acetyltransferase